mgnify:FL=1
MTEDEITAAQAVEALGRALRADPDYYYSWQSDIAVLLLYEGVTHERANASARDFLKTAFDA